MIKKLRSKKIVVQSGEEELPNNNEKIHQQHSAVASETDDKEFKFSAGLSEQEATERLKIYGRNELPEKVVPKWYIFISQLWQPMPIVIWIAAIIEAAIENYIDMAVLICIQFANASIGFYEITKAGDAVAALKKSLKPIATVKRDGKWRNIDAVLLVPGSLRFPFFSQ